MEQDRQYTFKKEWLKTDYKERFTLYCKKCEFLLENILKN